MRRDPFLHWLLTMVTFGQYGFLWGFRIARDADILASGDGLNLKKHRRVFLTGDVIYMTAFGISLASGDAIGTGTRADIVFWCVVSLAWGLTGYFLWILARTARMLRKVSETDSPRSGVVVFLFFFLAGSLPLLQHHLNKLDRTRLDPAGD